MKKIITLAALALTLVTGSSFAADSTNGKLNGEIKTSFQRDFHNATIISSEAHKNYTKVTFSMNSVVLFAFYGENGELMAVTRNILSTQLPVNLQMSLRNEYVGYWITELIELSGDGLNTYYVSIENADTKLTLRSNGDDTWELYEKAVKK